MKLTTRGSAAAVAIRDRVTFTTHGALRGRVVGGLGSWDSGELSGPDLDRFRLDCQKIDYVVYSYNTPIAWHKVDGVWHKVEQKFSRTTSAHQGKLYLI